MASRATTWRPATIVTRLAGLWREGLGVAGAAAILYGLAQVYPPVAWIAAGCVAIAVGVRA